MSDPIVQQQNLCENKENYEPNLLPVVYNKQYFKGLGFYLYNDKTMQNVSVFLNSKRLILRDNDKVIKNVLFEDILGASCKMIDIESKKIKSEEQQVLSLENSSILKLHLLIKPRKKLNDSRNSLKKPQPRNYEKFLLYHSDFETAMKWRNLILQVANNPKFDFNQYHNINDVPNFHRMLLVLIMTKSGQGKSQLYWSKCRKLLVRAGLDFVEIFADEFSTVSNFIESSTTEDLLKFDAIVSVSGDGLPHSLINMFYNRPDYEQLIKIPHMLIPGGSCNALTRNILEMSGEDNSLDSCSYVLAKGRSFKSDLTLYEIEGGTKIYGFGDMAWATPANIDLDSEVLRWFGNSRFYIYGAWEVLKLNKYQAKFTYSSTISQPPPLDEEIEGDEWTVIDDDFNFLTLHTMPWVGMDLHVSPLLEAESGLNYFLAIKGDQINRTSLLNTRKFFKPYSNIDDEELTRLGLTGGKIRAFRLEPYGEKLGKYSIDGEEYEAKRLQGYVIEEGITFVGMPQNSQE